MDAIALLEDDHRMVEALFRQYQGEGDLPAGRALVARIIELLRVHTEVEEGVFYPLAREATPGSAGLTAHAEEDHAAVAGVIAELEGMQQGDAGFHLAVLRLRELVERHVHMEEGELFSMVAAALGKQVLEEAGERMDRMKRSLAPRA